MPSFQEVLSCWDDLLQGPCSPPTAMDSLEPLPTTPTIMTYSLTLLTFKFPNHIRRRQEEEGEKDNG